MRRGGGPLSMSARKRVAARAAETSSSDDDEGTASRRDRRLGQSPRSIPPRMVPGPSSQHRRDAALSAVRDEFVSSFGAPSAPPPDAIAPPAAHVPARAAPDSRLARLEDENHALSERLAAQQAVNAKLERRCEVASADAAAHLRNLVELEEEGRHADAAHAVLLASSEEQARQLRDLGEERDRAVSAAAAEADLRERTERSLRAAEAMAEDLRQATETTESELRTQITELRRQRTEEGGAAEALADLTAELAARAAEHNSTRARLTEAQAAARRAEQRGDELERDLAQSRHEAARMDEASTAEVARVREALSRSEAKAEEVAAENRREAARRGAEVQSLTAELNMVREAKDSAVREAAAARTTAETAVAKTATTLRSKNVAVEAARTEGVAQLEGQIRLHTEELSSRQQEWEEERAALVRARDAAAAGRENAKAQERLVKAADKLRKQLAAAERENEALVRAAAQRTEADHLAAADAESSTQQKDTEVAELRLAVQVAKAETSDARGTASQLQGELEEARRASAAERLALQAVHEKEVEEARAARERIQQEQYEQLEAVEAARRQEKHERDSVEAEMALLRAQAAHDEQRVVQAQAALEKEIAEADAVKAKADEEKVAAEVARLEWTEAVERAAVAAADAAAADAAAADAAAAEAEAEAALQEAGTQSVLAFSGVVENVPVQQLGGAGSPIEAGSTPGRPGMDGSPISVGVTSPVAQAYPGEVGVSGHTSTGVQTPQEEADHTDRAARVLAEGVLRDVRAELTEAQAEASELRQEIMVRQQLAEQLSAALSSLQNNIDDQIAAEVESATEFQRDENTALKDEIKALHENMEQQRSDTDAAKHGEQAAMKKLESMSAVSLATESKLRQELAQALQLADAALSSPVARHENSTGQSGAATASAAGETESETQSAEALQAELRAVEEQAVALSTELGLLTADNTELQGTVTALSATVAVESEAAITARSELEEARRQIAKQRSRIASLRVQLGRAEEDAATDERDGTRTPHNRSASDSGRRSLSRERNGHTGRRGSGSAQSAARSRSVSPPRPQVDGDYKKGGVSWGRGPGATFGNASTGRTGAAELGKQHRGGGRATREDDVEPDLSWQQHGDATDPTPPRRRRRQGSDRRRGSDTNRRQDAPGSASPQQPSAAQDANSSPAAAASTIALRRLLEERDRLREVLAIARDAHAKELEGLKSALATARASAEQWQQACIAARSELTTAETELKERRRRSASAAKAKRQAAEAFRNERVQANHELGRQLGDRPM